MSTTKVVTGKVRFSYANVFSPTAMNEGETPKYGVSILIDKSDKNTMAKIEAAIKEAIAVGKSKLADKNGNVIESKLKLPVRDGDVEREGDEGYANVFFINASSLKRPGIVDADLNPIVDQDEFYSGCYGRASLNFYAFNSQGNKGIAVGLNNLQKLEDGDRLDGFTSAEADFGDELM